MRTSKVLIALVSVIIGISTVAAQETDLSQEMTQRWAAEREQRAQDQTRMEALMGTMTEEMTAIRAIKDSKKREALMATHREHMREAMGLMRGMGGSHMRNMMAEHAGSGMKHSAMSKMPKGKNNAKGMMRPRAEMSDAQRLNDLEIRLDMMQVMMESMMDTESH